MKNQKRKRKNEVSAGGVIVHGKYALVVKDGYGRWTIPKGHIEQGETAIMAARREILEEVGLKNLKLIGDLEPHKYVFTMGDTIVFKTVFLFLFESQGNSIKLNRSELSDYAWIDASKLADHVDYNNLKPIIAKAITLWTQKK